MPLYSPTHAVTVPCSHTHSVVGCLATKRLNLNESFVEHLPVCHVPMHVCWGLGVVNRLYGYQLKAQGFKHLQSSKKQRLFQSFAQFEGI